MSLNLKAKLAENILDLKSLEQKPTRDGYGLGLVQVADENSNVIALCADLTESTRTEAFTKKYPVPIEFIGVQNQFGQSGEPNELIERYGMGVSHIKEAVKKVVERK